MATPLALTLVSVSQKIISFVGSAIFFSGVLGGLLNIVVFLSLRTFRENACAFYLIVMSFVNVGNMLTGLLSRILISGFAVDWTASSPFYCKFRWYILQFCILTSFTCTCLAVIDQYMATNIRPRWRQCSNIKTAHCLVAVAVIVWLLHGIPYLVIYDTIHSPVDNHIMCGTESSIFRKYHSYGYLLTLAGIVPALVTTLFGVLARVNMRDLAYRTVPLVRRQLDKQLGVMVLVQVVVNFITTIPYTIISAVSTAGTGTQSPDDQAILDFASVLGMLLYFLSFAVSRMLCPTTCDTDGSRL